MEEEYDIDDVSCLKCGNEQIHSRDCTNIFCEGGYIDDSEEDPINYGPGESEHRCPECRGTEIERWCPKCGANLSGVKLDWPEEHH